MKMSQGLRMGFGVAWVVLVWGCAGGTARRPEGTSVPRIAGIGGVSVGYSTQDEFERAWGEGLTVVGGHPNSGRRWRVRGTDWLIATDGFEYSDRGLVVDALNLDSQKTDPNFPDAPYAKLDKKAFAWLGEISCGMTRVEVIAALNRQGVGFKEDGEDLYMEADGFSEITSQANASFEHWGARLVFKEGTLRCLQIAS